MIFFDLRQSHLSNSSNILHKNLFLFWRCILGWYILFKKYISFTFHTWIFGGNYNEKKPRKNRVFGKKVNFMASTIRWCWPWPEYARWKVFIKTHTSIKANYDVEEINGIRYLSNCICYCCFFFIDVELFVCFWNFKKKLRVRWYLCVAFISDIVSLCSCFFDCCSTQGGDVFCCSCSINY